MTPETSRTDRDTGAWHAESMLADVPFGTIWEAVVSARPDSVENTEPECSVA
jgi:hypothetical protein